MANWSPKIDDMLTEAFERCGLNAEQLSDYQMDQGLRSLNLVFSEFQNASVPLMFSLREVEFEIDQNTQFPINLNELYDPNQAEQGVKLLDSGIIDIASIAYREPGGTDIPLIEYGHMEWTKLPDKEQLTVQPTIYFLDRRTNPLLHLWQRPEIGTKIYMWVSVRIDTDADIFNDFDVPYRWFEAVVASLAVKIYAKQPDMDGNKYAALKIDARDSLRMAKISDGPSVDVHIIAPNIGL